MALNADILGQALYDVRQAFSDQTYDEIIALHGTLEAARLAEAKQEATVIINHFKTAAKLTVPGTGLTAGATAVTGSSITGTLS